MKIVLLGDSFTQGYAVDPGKCWADRLLLPGWEVVNAGMNGDSVMGMSIRFYDDVLSCQPDRVLITGGLNDLLYGGTGRDVTAFYASMIMEAREAGVAPIIGLEPSIDPNMAGLYWIDGIDYYRIANEQHDLIKDLRTMAKENGLPSVDFFKFVERMKAARPTKNYYVDGVHLVPEGHEKVAEFAARELTAIPY